MNKILDIFQFHSSGRDKVVEYLIKKDSKINSVDNDRKTVESYNSPSRDQEMIA